MYFVKLLFLILFFAVLGQFQCEAEEQVVWPDLSCHEGPNKIEMTGTLAYHYQDCSVGATPGPNDIYDEDEVQNLCVKLCMIVKSGLAVYEYQTDTFEFPEKGTKYYSFDDATHKKVHDQCADLFATVFYVEKERCNSVRANDVYDCIQKALC